jgi:hypothetical protein
LAFAKKGAKIVIVIGMKVETMQSLTDLDAEAILLTMSRKVPM